MKNNGRKTKQNHTHTTPSQPSTNNKQIKELKTNQKNLCPRKMDFAASIVVCLVFLGYPLITAGTSLPGLLPGFLGASHGCAEGTAWRLLPSASPTTTASSEDTAERRAGTSVPSLPAQEDVTILKWSGNIRGAESSGKGICHPQHSWQRRRQWWGWVGGLGVHAS